MISVSSDSPYTGFPCGSDGKESSCNAGDLGLIPGSGRSPGVATHSSILAWRIQWTEEPGRLHSPWGCKQLDMTGRLTLSLFHTHTEVQNSLTWDIWFSLISKKSTCPLLQNLCITWLFLSPPQSSSLGVTWDAVSGAQSPKNSHWIKHNSQLLGCEYFLSWHKQRENGRESWKFPPAKDLINYISITFPDRAKCKL